MARKLIRNPLYIITYALFVFFIVVPVIYTFITAIFSGDGIFLLEKQTYLLLAKSILISSTIAILSTAFGGVLGFLIFKTNVKFRNFFKLIILIPLFISPYIFAVAWKSIMFLFLNANSITFSYFGLISVLTITYTPISMLVIGGALSNIDSQLEESALILTNIKSVITKILLPLIKPALLTSFIVVFIFSISEFSVPVYFGVKVFTTEIFTQFSAFYNHSLAVMQSLLLVVICVLLLYAERKYISDAPFLSVGSKGSINKLIDFKKMNNFGLLFLILYFNISILLPILILVIQSINGGISIFIHAFNLLLPTFINSIFLAFLGAIIIVFIGFVSAFFNSKNKKSLTFNWLLLLIFAIPSTVYGVSLIKFYNRPALDIIYSSYAIILIAYIGKFSFIASKLISNAISQIPNNLDEIAQIQGIKTFSRFRVILFPLIFPSISVAFIISFIFSLGELGTTIMVYPPGTEIMPIKVFTLMSNAPQSLVSAMSLIVLILTLLIIVIFYLLLKPILKTYNLVND